MDDVLPQRLSEVTYRQMITHSCGKGQNSCFKDGSEKKKTFNFEYISDLISERT